MDSSYSVAFTGQTTTSQNLFAMNKTEWDFWRFAPCISFAQCAASLRPHFVCILHCCCCFLDPSKKKQGKLLWNVVSKDCFPLMCIIMLLHALESQNVPSDSSLLHESVRVRLTWTLPRMPFVFLLSSRCHQFSERHPLEVHLLFLAPSCCRRRLCLQEELLSSPPSLTRPSWHRVSSFFYQLKERCECFHVY